MKLEKGDIALVKTKTTTEKLHLVKVLSSDKDTIEGVITKNMHIPSMKVTATFDKSDILLNLGNKPHPGKVYGIDTTHTVGSQSHDALGKMFFFYKPEKQIIKDLFKAGDKIADILQKLKLDFLLDDLVWEITPYMKQRYAGMYTVLRGKSKDDEPTNIITINPEIMPASEYVYILAHELGHHLHLKYLTSKKLNARWVQLFNKSIKVATVDKSDCKALLEALIVQEDPPSAFKSGLDEEDALRYKWILRYIASTHAVSVKELDMLFEADMRSDIEELWPKRTLTYKDLKPIISEYATVNYKETFAESFAYYVDKKKRDSLPKQVIKLLEESISYCKVKGK